MKKIYILFTILLCAFYSHSQSLPGNQVNNGFRINAPRLADMRAGKLSTVAPFRNIPYASVAEANATVLQAYRAQCVWVNILVNGHPRPYWWYDGVADGDLVDMMTSLGIGSGGNLTFASGLTNSNGTVKLGGIHVDAGTLLDVDGAFGISTHNDDLSLNVTGPSANLDLSSENNIGISGKETYVTGSLAVYLDGIGVTLTTNDTYQYVVRDPVSKKLHVKNGNNFSFNGTINTTPTTQLNFVGTPPDITVPNQYATHAGVMALIAANNVSNPAQIYGTGGPATAVLGAGMGVGVTPAVINSFTGDDKQGFADFTSGSSVAVGGKVLMLTVYYAHSYPTVSNAIVMPANGDIIPTGLYVESYNDRFEVYGSTGPNSLTVYKLSYHVMGR